MASFPGIARNGPASGHDDLENHGSSRLSGRRPRASKKSTRRGRELSEQDVGVDYGQPVAKLLSHALKSAPLSTPSPFASAKQSSLGGLV